MNKYIIAVDEKGQPYIAHSVWGKAKAFGGKVVSGVKSFGRSARSAGGRAYKYILKVGEGAKAQYAYTKEELGAYYDMISAERRWNEAAYYYK